MNNTLIIGIIVVAVLGTGALFLFSESEPIVVENDVPSTVTDDVTQAPPEDPTSPPVETDIEVPEPETIIDIAAGTAELTTLAATIEAAGLTGTLAAEGPYTILAPTDEAFAAIPEEALAELTAPENIEDLQTVLGLHVIPGIITSADLEDGTTVTTLAGDELTVAIDASGQITVGGAAVIGADVLADNGVIHIIDTVITDPA